jgi:hypothetical protein
MDGLSHQTNADKSDGEVVWSWHLDADAKWATMLRIAPATVTIKPDHRGEREGNR